MGLDGLPDWLSITAAVLMSLLVAMEVLVTLVMLLRFSHFVGYNTVYAKILLDYLFPLSPSFSLTPQKHYHLSTCFFGANDAVIQPDMPKYVSPKDFKQNIRDIVTRLRQVCHSPP